MLLIQPDEPYLLLIQPDPDEELPSVLVYPEDVFGSSASDAIDGLYFSNDRRPVLMPLTGSTTLSTWSSVSIPASPALYFWSGLRPNKLNKLLRAKPVAQGIPSGP